MVWRIECGVRPLSLARHVLLDGRMSKSMSISLKKLANTGVMSSQKVAAILKAVTGTRQSTAITGRLAQSIIGKLRDGIT